MRKSKKSLIEKLKKFNFTKPKIKLKARKRKFVHSQNRQQRDKNSSRLKFIITNLITSRFLFIIFLLILFFFVAFIVSTLYKFHNLRAFDNPTSWDRNSRLNFVVLGIDQKDNNYKFVDAIVVISMSMKQNEVSIFAIDPDIRVLDDNGDYIEIRKLYNMKINGKSGVRNVIDEIEDLVALNITKYIEVDRKDFMSLQPIFGNLKISLKQEVQDKDIVLSSGEFVLPKGDKSLNGSNAYNILRINDNGADMRLSFQVEGLRNYLINLKSLKVLFKIFLHIKKFDCLETNFSKQEIWALFMFLRKINFDNIRYGFTKSTSLKYDEYHKKYPKIKSIDKDLEAVFIDYALVREQARLEILNGTEQFGLANKYSRYFSNLGIRVVRTGNSLQPSDKTILFIKNVNLYPDTVEYIRSVFNDKIEIVEQDYKYKHIGDMVLVIGTDIDDN